MAEMLNYAPDLRSITGGRGDYTMEFARYEEVPAHLAQKVISRRAAPRRRRPQRPRCSAELRVSGRRGAAAVRTPTVRAEMNRLPQIEEHTRVRRLPPHDAQGRAGGAVPDARRASGGWSAQLCAPRAQQEGWIRESAAPDDARAPAAPARAPRAAAPLRRAGAERRDAAPTAPGARARARPDAPDASRRPTARSRRRRAGLRAPAQARRRPAQPAARARGADQRAAQDRPRARPLQRAPSTRARWRASRARSARRSASALPRPSRPRPRCC